MIRVLKDEKEFKRWRTCSRRNGKGDSLFNDRTFRFFFFREDVK